MGASICKLNVSGVIRLVIFSSTKKLVILLDNANWYFLYYFNVMVCSMNSFTIYCTLLFF